MNKVPVGVLISGRGSNMEALIAAAKDSAYPVRIALVLSNKADAGGLAIAREAGIPTAVVEHRSFGKDREAHEGQVHQALLDHDVQIVALAGYMRVLTPWLVNAWAGRMINIHPSLLPAYPGLDTHARALGDGVAEHGCTVHLVTAGVDEGPVLGQARVPVLPQDDEATLAARVLAAEHVLYPEVLGQFATNLTAPGGR